MTKTELHELIDRVRRRHNRRVLSLLALMLAVFFVGLKLAPRSPDSSALTHRQLFIYGVTAVYLTVAITGGWTIFCRIKTDCSAFGVLCPKCGHELYTKRHLLLGGRGTRDAGICPHCHQQLIDASI